MSTASRQTATSTTHSLQGFITADREAALIRDHEVEEAWHQLSLEDELAAEAALQELAID